MNIGSVFGGKCWSGSSETGRGGIIRSFSTLGGVCWCGTGRVCWFLGGAGFGGSFCATSTLGAGA
eukprot:11252045-Ditylum_brightwellii.AAC.1